MCSSDLYEAGGISAEQQVVKCGLSGVFAAKRLDGAEERRAESVLSADLCGMCKTGGVICHSLKIPASP